MTESACATAVSASDTGEVLRVERVKAYVRRGPSVRVTTRSHGDTAIRNDVRTTLCRAVVTGRERNRPGVIMNAMVSIRGFIREDCRPYPIRRHRVDGDAVGELVKMQVVTDYHVE